jgi:hypothetical protein
MLELGKKGSDSVAATQGGKVFNLPREEQTKWVNVMPNLGKEWAERAEKAGLPGNKVLNAYMEEMRKAGAKPVRDWDKN